MCAISTSCQHLHAPRCSPPLSSQVCSRLGLVSLAYLWHQPQQQLLADMVASDIEAVLVKVAALGLEPHKHLGNSIAQLQPYLLGLRDRFGCNVCGEGGEYETLTLDCPAFKHGRIVLDDWQVGVTCVMIGSRWVWLVCGVACTYVLGKLKLHGVPHAVERPSHNGLYIYMPLTSQEAFMSAAFDSSCAVVLAGSVAFP